ncbi:MAG: amino acid permease [Chlamydiia bacterium]|nr:amino acid permease [Chlamydiia bacterium]
MHKKLGFWVLTSLVVGNMVGSGVFLLPASLAQYGSITIFSWIATAIGAVFLALVFATLSKLFPRTGGPYVYCKEGFGDFIGFQVAYNFWICKWAGSAAIATALTGYLSAFFPILEENNVAAFFLTAGMVWFFSLVNIVGIHLAGGFQLTLTILKYIPLILATVIGLFYIDLENLSYFNVSGKSNFSALSSGAMLTLWAFLGLESASIPADDVVNPEKTIPRATIIGTLLAAVVYIFSTVSIMGVVPMPELRESAAPFADFAGKLFGPWGMYAMGGVAVISCAGALNGWILVQGQIPFAAARDKLFPKVFGKMTEKRSPVNAIIISSVLITFLLMFNLHKNLVDQFTIIISLATLAGIIAFLYTSVAEFVIYIKYPEKMQRKKVVKTLTVSGLAFIYTFWATASAGQEVVFYGSLLLFSSIPIYGWMQWQKYRKSVLKNG